MAETVNESPVSDSRELSLVNAAIRVFARYGVKRSTMADVASEAGVTRQTVYNCFSNKENLVRAVIRGFAEQQLAAIYAELSDAESESVEARLGIFLRHLFLTPQQMLQASPHADDILEGFNTFAHDEIEETSADAQRAIAELFEPYPSELAKLGLTPIELARLVHTSARGIKLKASSSADAEQMVRGLVRTVVAALGV